MDTPETPNPMAEMFARVNDMSCSVFFTGRELGALSHVLEAGIPDLRAAIANAPEGTDTTVYATLADRLDEIRVRLDGELAKLLQRAAEPNPAPTVEAPTTPQ